MKETKHNPAQKPKPDFIEFGKVQKSYLNEVLRRQRREFNEAVESVYEELGIVEKILQAHPDKYKLRKDCSGLDVFPLEKEPDKS